MIRKQRPIYATKTTPDGAVVVVIVVDVVDMVVVVVVVVAVVVVVVVVVVVIFRCRLFRFSITCIGIGAFLKITDCVLTCIDIGSVISLSVDLFLSLLVLFRLSARVAGVCVYLLVCAVLEDHHLH